MIVLMDPTTNGHGRWLIREGNALFVLSGCCKSTIKGNYTDEHSDHTWAICDVCKAFLQVNDDGWDSEVPDLLVWVGTRADMWSSWGKFWFGLKDFAMEVKR